MKKSFSLIKKSLVMELFYWTRVVPRVHKGVCGGPMFPVMSLNIPQQHS